MYKQSMGSSFHAAKRGLVGMMCVAVIPFTACAASSSPTSDYSITIDMVDRVLGESQELLDRGFRDVDAIDVQEEWRQYNAKYGHGGNRCTITVIKQYVDEEDVYGVNHADDGADGLPVAAGWNWLAYRNNTGGPIWNPTVEGFRTDPSLSWCFQPGPPDRP